MAEEYISLKEAAKYCPYSPDYLKLRARQGKLKAFKKDRNWFTTKEWIEEYTNKQKSRVRVSGNLVTRRSWVLSKRLKKFLFSRFKLGKCFIFIMGLLIIFIFLGAIINFKPAETILEKIIPAKVIEIKR